MDKLPISRANLAGKRRMVIYISDLATYADMLPSVLINELHDSQLRKEVDFIYNPKKRISP